MATKRVRVNAGVGGINGFPGQIVDAENDDTLKAALAANLVTDVSDLTKRDKAEAEAQTAPDVGSTSTK